MSEYPVVDLYKNLKKQIIDLEELLSIALDALNFSCGSSDPEIYKCSSAAIRAITDRIKSI